MHNYAGHCGETIETNQCPSLRSGIEKVFLVQQKRKSYLLAPPSDEPGPYLILFSAFPPLFTHTFPRAFFLSFFGVISFLEPSIVSKFKKSQNRINNFDTRFNKYNRLSEKDVRVSKIYQY